MQIAFDICQNNSNEIHCFKVRKKNEEKDWCDLINLLKWRQKVKHYFIDRPRMWDYSEACLNQTLYKLNIW
jgi:hypothetical protein